MEEGISNKGRWTLPREKRWCGHREVEFWLPSLAEQLRSLLAIETGPSCAPGRWVSPGYLRLWQSVVKPRIQIQLMPQPLTGKGGTAAKSIAIWDLFAFVASGRGLSCRSLMTLECSNKTLGPQGAAGHTGLIVGTNSGGLCVCFCL